MGGIVSKNRVNDWKESHVKGDFSRRISSNLQVENIEDDLQETLVSNKSLQGIHDSVLFGKEKE